MDNDVWKTPPKIFHKPMQVYLGGIKLEFGSKNVHGKYRKPVDFVYGPSVDRHGRLRYGHKKIKSKTYKFVIPFTSIDISVVEGTLREPRFWYNGGNIRISQWSILQFLPQELEKICIDYKRRMIRGSIVEMDGKRLAHWFSFHDPQIIVRGFREDE